MNETYTTLVGSVCSDIKQRRTMDGVKVVHFRAVSNERRFDRSTGEWIDGEHLYVNVTCWRRVANGVVASLNKGDPVVVTGRLYTRSYEHEGQRRVSVEVDAQAVGPDLARCTAEISRSQPGSAEAAPQEGGLAGVGASTEPDTAAA
jgi:single-strand DNA-binding protein